MPSSRAIWKFVLDITDEQTIDIPKGATILSVGEQHEKVVLWAIVTPSSPTVKRTIRIFGTGHPIDDNDSMGRFVGTVAARGGFLVWHIFDHMDPL